MDEERTFTFAPNASITRGGIQTRFDDIQVGDIAFFGFSGTVIQNIKIMERERTLLGILMEVRLPETLGASPILILQETDGPTYKLRVLSATEFSRGYVSFLGWDDLRIGDAITAEVEFDRLIRVHAVGAQSTVYGRLNEIRITERNTEITLALEDGTNSSFFVRPGGFGVYTLRIGMQLRIRLDSREVINIQVQSRGHATSILGFIQSIQPDGTMVIVEGQGTDARTHNITANNNTTITRGGATLNFNDFRANMNVYINLTAPGANTARSVTVLP